MAFKSVLKPEGSLILGAALAGMVYSVYQLQLGPSTNVMASDANHPVLETSRRKAGYTSLVMVGALAVLAKDPNMVILGGGAIVAMELQYRHAIMAHPDTGKIVPPAPTAYQPAQDTVPDGLQADAG